MAGFNSYEPLLKKYVQLIQPKQIFEWGPGGSTIILASDRAAQVTTVEHDFKYYCENAAKLRRFSNVTVCWAKSLQDYIEFPKRLRCKFDLVFVDGLCDTRVACLKVAAELLTEKGVVILHDSEREKYAEGKALYNVVEERDGTAVLVPA